MAVTDSIVGGVADASPFYLRWPTGGVEPDAAWADFDPTADELLVYFDRPRGSVSVAINTPDRDFVYLLVDDTEVVGVHVDDLRAWVAAAHPRWAPLMHGGAAPKERRQAIAALIADAAGLFALYGVGRNADPRP